MKRLFVVPYLLSLLVIATYAIVQLSLDEAVLPWSMVLMATVPMLMFMLGIALSGKPRTREHLFPELLLACFAVIGAAYAQDAIATLLCVSFGVIGIALYDFWYSNLGRATGLLDEGSQIPEFHLDDVEGNFHSSSELTKTPAVWIFIRGNWCPLCVAQVKEIANEYRDLKDKGVEVFIITPQPELETKKLAEKFDAPMRFMVDKESGAARKLGLLHEGGVPAGLPGYGADTVYPTVVITAEGGKILYSDETHNYRIRPEPAEFLKVLDNA